MIHLIGSMREIAGVAVSGGPDSMALLSFLHHGKHRPDAYFFDHGTDASKQAKEFLTDYCATHQIPLHQAKLKGSKPKSDSWEEFWRNERYAWLHSAPCPTRRSFIATAHHLNDVAETFIWGCAHGKPRYIHYIQPSSGGKIIRPLLLTTKRELLNWCSRKKIPYVEDQSNNDLRFVRNRIRNNIIPELQQVNPGFLTSMKRLMERRLDNYHCFGGSLPCPPLHHQCQPSILQRESNDC